MSESQSIICSDADLIIKTVGKLTSQRASWSVNYFFHCSVDPPVGQ